MSEKESINVQGSHYARSLAGSKYLKQLKEIMHIIAPEIRLKFYGNIN
jgi:hypothetical protein